VRVADLDRDHSAIFVADNAIESTFLYERMAEASYAELRCAPGKRIIDVAAGLGKDARALAKTGARVVNAEPSKTLTELERMLADGEKWPDLGSQVARVRAWAESLPFASGQMDGSLCKGSLDHFDDPLACIAEMARVTHPRGRVVLAVANMEALGLRIARLANRRTRAQQGPRVRRHYDAPPDHLTRYDAALLRAQVERYVEIEAWVGVSLFWGNFFWGRLLKRCPGPLALALLRAADAVARRVPSWADLIIVAGRPKTSGRP
jgi:SAM-dependent methyltransferase